MGGSSASSSIDSNATHPHHSLSSSPSLMQTKAMVKNETCVQDSSRRDLSTDLRLGLTISPPQDDLSSTSTLQREDWPPIKNLLRSSLVDTRHSHQQQQDGSLFVKVYMEGIPIGRKVDLYALDGYNDLVHSLSLMFTTNILCPETDRVHSDKYHILTYEDREGDWMMVGDVPWEMFVTTVKRLKITRADRC